MVQTVIGDVESVCNAGHLGPMLIAQALPFVSSMTLCQQLGSKMFVINNQRSLEVAKAKNLNQHCK